MSHQVAFQSISAQIDLAERQTGVCPDVAVQHPCDRNPFSEMTIGKRAGAFLIFPRLDKLSSRCLFLGCSLVRLRRSACGRTCAGGGD